MSSKEIIQKSEIFSSRPTYDKTELIFYLVFLTLLLVITILLKRNFDNKSKTIKPLPCSAGSRFNGFDYENYRIAY